MGEIDTTKEQIDGLAEVVVDIQTAEGVKSVPGWAHKSCPGLAVTMHPFGCFMVTHINTGFKISALSERASTAMLTMSQFALLAHMKDTKWSDLDKEAAITLISDLTSKDVPFEGCTRTSLGVTRKMTVGEWFEHSRIPVFDEFPWEAIDPLEMAMNNFQKIEVPA